MTVIDVFARTPRRLRVVAFAVAVATAMSVVCIGSGPASGHAGRTPSTPGSLLGGASVAVGHHEGGTFDLDTGWRFALVSSTGVTDPTGAYANAASPTFDDSGWRSVAVPHDWSVELNPTAGPGTSSGTGFY
jgi:beta-galactosidase